MREWLARIWPGVPTNRAELAHELRNALVDVSRLTLVTVLAYLLTMAVTTGPVDLTGALTAMLVTQASLRGSFRTGLTRVAAVLLGIGVALLFSLFVGLSWWSLGLAVFAALMLARVFQLGGASLETAISAMLILGSSGFEVAATTRLTSTLIGTVVGIGFPLLLPRRISIHELSADVRKVAERLAHVFEQAGLHLAKNTMTSSAAADWLAAGRDVVPLITEATESLDRASELRQWNRRVLYEADVVPLLRDGLEALDRTQLATRQLFYVMSAEAPEHPNPDDGYGDQVRRVFSIVLREVGLSIGGFGDLLAAEAAGDATKMRLRYAATVSTLRETRARLTDLMLVDTGQTDLWLMRGSILSAIDQIMQHLDAAAHDRRHEAWRATQLGLQLPEGVIGPRIRTPWGIAAQRRLQRRAERLRQMHPEEVYDWDNETTVTIPAVTDPDDPDSGEQQP